MADSNIGLFSLAMEIKILKYVVDDDGVSLKAIDQAFKNAGIVDYELFSNPLNMLDVLDESVKIAVVDYYMEQMNGLEVLKRIKAINSKCFVIICTSFKDFDALSELSNNGMFRHIDKNKSDWQDRLVVAVDIACTDIINEHNFIKDLLELKNPHNDLWKK